MILALDPGTERTAYVLLTGLGAPLCAGFFGVLPNAEMWGFLGGTAKHPSQRNTRLVIEMIASYGMPVGREVFETCVWIGRFIEAWESNGGSEHRVVYRRDVKMHLCGDPRAKDSNIRQAILDRFPRTGGGATPQIGTKKQPGPLYGFSGSDMFAALGVALTYYATPDKFHALGREVVAP